MGRIPRFVGIVILVPLLFCGGCASWHPQHGAVTDVSTTYSSGSFLQDQLYGLSSASANN
jgi:hypothetical protein